MIRIENLGEESVRIRERHWTIYSLTGCLESMVGTGIGGQVITCFFTLIMNHAFSNVFFKYQNRLKMLIFK